MKKAMTATALGAAILLACVPAAHARSGYAVARGDNAVVPFDLATDAVGPQIALGSGKGPEEVAISPDGSTAYVTDELANSVSVIDLATGTVSGSPIKVGNAPLGIAITPDGSTVYAVNDVGGSLTPIDTATRKAGPEITLAGVNPMNVAISPDGKTAYVTDLESKEVSVVDLRAGKEVGSITVKKNPMGIAITPNGATVYVTDFGAAAVTPISTLTGVAGPSIPVGERPDAVAISPDGSTAYVASREANDVSVISTATNEVRGAPIPVGKGPEGIAVTGRAAFTANISEAAVTPVDLATGVAGAPIPIGASTESVTLAPDQEPHAAFTQTGAAGAKVAFDASASTDPDGRIASYTWSFGDGRSASGPTVSHAYASSGTYTVTLSVDDGEGCPGFAFTGQTASCNGGSVASTAATVKVTAKPRVRISCPKSAKPGGCRFALQVVSAKPHRSRGKGKRGRASKPIAESKVARAKLAPGHHALLTLTPKPKFAAKLERAKKLLVREVETVGGKSRTSYRRLKVAR
jgi:YVTN family beta-propeller protein